MGRLLIENRHVTCIFQSDWAISEIQFKLNKPENPFQNYDVAKKTLKTNQRILVTQKETL